MKVLTGEEERAVGDLIRSLGSEVEPLTAIIGRLEAEIERGPDPAKWVPRDYPHEEPGLSVYMAKCRELKRTEEELQVARRALTDIEYALKARLQVAVLVEGMGAVQPIDRGFDDPVRFNVEDCEQAFIRAGYSLLLNTSALKHARREHLTETADRLFHALVGFLRTDLSEKLGVPIRDPWAAMEWPSGPDAISAAAFAQVMNRIQRRPE